MKIPAVFLYAVAIPFLFLTSCDGLVGEIDPQAFFDPGQTVVTTDSNILGTWDVVKYEACNIKGKIIKTETDVQAIHGTYWRFVMAVTGDLALWWGAYDVPSVTTRFSYNKAAGLFYYGEYGCGEVETLTEDSFVFLSTDFFPAAWAEDPAVTNVRVFLKKADSK